ncbi:hypothetical protein DJ68_14045, partial [Halorubrum sp. C3]
GGGGGGGAIAPSNPEPVVTDAPANISTLATATLELETQSTGSVGTPTTTSDDTVIQETVFNDSEAEGELTVRDYNTTPASTGSPPGELVMTGEIFLAEEHMDTEVTYSLNLDNVAREVSNPSDYETDTLTVWSYDDGYWEPVDTSVTTLDLTDDGLEATMTGDGHFAVTNGDPEDAVEPSEDESSEEDSSDEISSDDSSSDGSDSGSTDGSDGSEGGSTDGTDGEQTSDPSTDDSTPGFTGVTALIALVVATLVVRRKQ